MEAQVEVTRTEDELVETRPNLSMDELAELTDRGVILEKHLHRFGLWMFSLKGYRSGKFVRGALFAGNCIVVQARTYEAALHLAREGLEATVIHALDWLKQSELDRQLVNPVAEAFGRRVGGLHEPHVDPHLDALLRHKLGGEPWRF